MASLLTAIAKYPLSFRVLLHLWECTPPDRMLHNSGNDANLTLRALLLLTLKGRKVIEGAIVEHFEEAGASEALEDQYKSSFLEATARQSLQHPQNIGF